MSRSNLNEVLESGVKAVNDALSGGAVPDLIIRRCLIYPDCENDTISPSMFCSDHLGRDHDGNICCAFCKKPPATGYPVCKRHKEFLLVRYSRLQRKMAEGCVKMADELEELCEETEEQKETIDEQRKELEERRKMIGEHRLRILRLKVENEDLGDDNTSLRKEIEDITDDNDVLRVENENLKTENEKLRADKQELKEDIDKWVDEACKQCESNEKFKIENEILRETADAIAAERDELLERLDNIERIFSGKNKRCRDPEDSVGKNARRRIVLEDDSDDEN